jgi:hydroxysqualene synthase
MATTLTDPTRTASTENFPVGSWLIAPERRPVVAAYYKLARAADDIADSSRFDMAEKLRRLDTIDANLTGRISDDPDAVALRDLFLARGLTLEHARHLLQAFKTDAANRQCRNWSDLLAYCRYSAAPVGRFLLELHGEDKAAWPASDALCTALQILNHLQDCQNDWHQLRRLYIPSDWLHEARITEAALLQPKTSPALRHVFNRVLEGVDRLNLTAAALPGQLKDRRLRMEATAIVFISKRLAKRLRKRDPLASRVELSALEKAAALIWGAVRGLRA